MAYILEPSAEVRDIEAKNLTLLAPIPCMKTKAERKHIASFAKYKIDRILVAAEFRGLPRMKLSITSITSGSQDDNWF